MRILIVEDEHALARNIQKYLILERYSVDVAFDGEEGLQKALKGDYDCIVLDLNLPKMDGFTVCERLRKEKKGTPILMLTALGDKENIVRGLDTGADDYLKKPFEMEELCARIRSLLRRKSGDREPILRTKYVSLNSNTRQVLKADTPISLAPKEYAVLEFLLRNKGIAQDRMRIIEHVWGEEDRLMFSQTLDVHIAYLRKKLGKDVIETVSGKGYMIPK